MEKFKVAAANCEDYDSAKIQNAVDVVIEQLGGLEQFVSKDAKVFIKVNLVRDMAPEKCGTTHPEVVIAVINRLKGITDNIIVGDSSGGLYTKGAMNAVYAKCRMTDFTTRPPPRQGEKRRIVRRKCAKCRKRCKTGVSDKMCAMCG